MISTLLQVMIGGAVGSGLRWGAGVLVYRITGPGFPLAIITVNVLGSFLMGVCVVMAAHKSLTHLSPLVMTGLLGGFTTFSAFSLEAVTLMERGQLGQAAGYVVLSVGASLGALFMGVLMARGLVA